MSSHCGPSSEADGSLNPSLCLLLGCEFHSSLDCRSSVLLLSYQLSKKIDRFVEDTVDGPLASLIAAASAMSKL